eukprot:TRINITY_DN66746_c8_g1_i1.p2 TRINITY_DN66746_c8_g1~~TRINITY_DN66746_c8_g1_i1.p2  ORF type:complete len:244 (+),score=98.01 TRINITY_DN66746_c8_g1_i1:79-810(+)
MSTVSESFHEELEMGCCTETHSSYLVGLPFRSIVSFMHGSVSLALTVLCVSVLSKHYAGLSDDEVNNFVVLLAVGVVSLPFTCCLYSANPMDTNPESISYNRKSQRYLLLYLILAVSMFAPLLIFSLRTVQDHAPDGQKTLTRLVTATGIALAAVYVLGVISCIRAMRLYHHFTTTSIRRKVRAMQRAIGDEHNNGAAAGAAGAFGSDPTEDDPINGGADSAGALRSSSSPHHHHRGLPDSKQ